MTESSFPRVSAARREQVAERISCYSEDYDQWPTQDREDVASEIIAALLPDAEQFMELLDDLTYSATEYGHAAPSSERERRASRKTVEARDALIALVYGEEER